MISLSIDDLCIRNIRINENVRYRIFHSDCEPLVIGAMGSNLDVDRDIGGERFWRDVGQSDSRQRTVWRSKQLAEALFV